MSQFIKRYATQQRAQTALAHCIWLSNLNSGLAFPNLVSAKGTGLAFDAVSGVQPGPSQLSDLATAIGLLHRAAAPWVDPSSTELVRQEFLSGIKDFSEPRREALIRAASENGLSPGLIQNVLAFASAQPYSIYKDSNLRNFILTDHAIVAVDFDDLTLAPYGYDLAKLVLSMSMTHGQLTILTVSETLTAYNAAVGWESCTPLNFALWAELNWLLTAKYLGRNGYVHPWPQLRPWANPLHTGGSEWQ